MVKGCGGCGKCNICCESLSSCDEDEPDGDTYVGTVFQYLAGILQNTIQIKRLLAYRTSRKRLKSIVREALENESSIDEFFIEEKRSDLQINQASINY